MTVGYYDGLYYFFWGHANEYPPVGGEISPMPNFNLNSFYFAENAQYPENSGVAINGNELSLGAMQLTYVEINGTIYTNFDPGYPTLGETIVFTRTNPFPSAGETCSIVIKYTLT